MTKAQIHAVQSSWRSIIANGPEIPGRMFYTRLFGMNPEIRYLFSSSVKGQSVKLFSMIGFIVQKLESLGEILEEIGKLAAKHNTYQVKPQHYPMVGSALLWTMEQVLANAWNDELEEAWAVAYNTLAEAMINVQQSQKANEPA